MRHSSANASQRAGASQRKVAIEQVGVERALSIRAPDLLGHASSDHHLALFHNPRSRAPFATKAVVSCRTARHLGEFVSRRDEGATVRWVEGTDLQRHPEELQRRPWECGPGTTARRWHRWQPPRPRNMRGRKGSTAARLERQAKTAEKRV